MSLVAATSNLLIDGNYSASSSSLRSKSAKVGQPVVVHTAVNREGISITKTKR
jgi:hypothetical protein